MYRGGSKGGQGEPPPVKFVPPPVAPQKSSRYHLPKFSAKVIKLRMGSNIDYGLKTHPLTALTRAGTH